MKNLLLPILFFIFINSNAQIKTINFGENIDIEKVITTIFNKEGTELVDTISTTYHNIDFFIIVTRLRNEESFTNNIGIIELLRTEMNPNWTLNSFAENVENDFNDYHTIESIEIHELWENEFLLSLDYRYDNGRNKVKTEKHFYLQNKKVLSLITDYSRLEINNNSKSENDAYSIGAEFGRTFKINHQKNQIEANFKGIKAYNEQLKKYMPVNQTEIYKLDFNKNNEREFKLIRTYNN
jgi:hypothetical protein